MKAQYHNLIADITALAPVWQTRMALDHFEIEHAFLDSYYDDDGADDFKVSAVTEVRWNYLEAKVKWYLPSIARHTPEHVEQVLVHELCHVLLAPEQAAVLDKYADQRELATEMCARAVYAGWQQAA